MFGRNLGWMTPFALMGRRNEVHGHPTVVTVETNLRSRPLLRTTIQPVPHSKRDDNWFDVTSDVLNAGVAHDWAIRPDCGAVTLFSGTVRDHAEGRDDVVALTYEAYEEKTIEAFAAITTELRSRWTDVGRVVMWHRIGRLELSEVSVIVAVSSPHRPVAFEAARFAIDALKVSAPIWKHEEWSEGADWGTGASLIEDPRNVSSESN